MSIDWLKIITAHVAWKQRLEQFLQGTSTEDLKPEVIAVDNRCDLGKWIYGAGKTFNRSPEYVVVKDLHANFHTIAAKIVSHHLLGESQQAQALLDGEYSRISNSLKRHILDLRGAVER